MADLFPPFEAPRIPVAGSDDAYPVARVFCVGRNYEAHAAEMGNEVDREAPFYFTKSPASVALSGATVPYPPATSDYHHEVELVLVLGAPVFRAGMDEARAAIWGYGCGLDMTRRDLQAVAKDKRRPWDVGKDVEGSAILGPLAPASAFDPEGGAGIRLRVNGALRQDASLGEMIHGCAAIVADLSRLYRLGPGDVVMTGTPAGVGAVRAGDVLEGEIDGLAPVSLAIGPPA